MMMKKYHRKHWQTGHDSLRLLLDATSCDWDHTVIEKVRRRRSRRRRGEEEEMRNTSVTKMPRPTSD